MSALARMLLAKGIAVSGSDVQESYTLNALRDAGAVVAIGHDERNVPPEAIVVFSSDIKAANPELLAAKNRNCVLLHRSDLLAQLANDKKCLALAGTHGKTTTTSLLISILAKADCKASFMVGGILQEQKSNAEINEGEYFVLEADESDGTFLKYEPFGAVITNIDTDHLSHYKTLSALEKTFLEFAQKVQSFRHLFWCGDDMRLQQLSLPGNSYGFGPQNALCIQNYSQDGWRQWFTLTYDGKAYENIELALAGKHNVLNAAAVSGLCLELGIEEQAIRAGLSQFKGVGRRCEHKGLWREAFLIDDYAHHPTEIKATLEAIRSAIGQNRLIAIYQPHRYSRLQYCMGSFDRIFRDADQVVVTDIYHAGEEAIPGITKEAILAEIARSHRHSTFWPRHKLSEYLSKEARPGDTIVTLGAGDITKLSAELHAIKC